MPHPKSIIPDPLRPPTMAEIERAARHVPQGFTVARCLAAGNMSHGTLYYWLDGGPFLGPTTDKSAGDLAPTTDQSAVGGGAPGARMLPPIPRRRRRRRQAPQAAGARSRLGHRAAYAHARARGARHRAAAGAALRRNAGTRARRAHAGTTGAVGCAGWRRLAPDGAGEAAAARQSGRKRPVDIDAFREEFARRIHAFAMRTRRSRRRRSSGAEEQGGAGVGVIPLRAPGAAQRDA